MLYSKAWDSLMCPLASLRAGPFDSAQGRLCGSEEKIILFSLPAVELSRFAFGSGKPKGLPYKTFSRPAERDSLRCAFACARAHSTPLRAGSAAARKNPLIDIFSRP